MNDLIIESLHGGAARTTFNLEKINKYSSYNLFNLILVSERRYTEQIKEVAKKIEQSENQIKIILLAGPSAAGKTTTSNLLRLQLAQKKMSSIVISLDNFFVDREKTPKQENGEYDFECLEALDLEYLNKFIDDLLTKRAAKMPVFNFVKGRREEEYHDVVLEENTIVIFEGIHALNPKLVRSHQDKMFKIYICLNTNFVVDDKVFIPAKDLRLMRRLNRDYLTRGASAKATLGMWANVCAGEEKYIKPFKSTADYVVDSTHAYEPLLYANYLKPLLEIEQDNEKAKELYDMLNYCNQLNNDFVPPSSLLWEFLGEDHFE